MDLQQLNEEGRSLWDQKAAFWDALHGDEGNRFHLTLISPAVERLLELQPGQRILDVGCGSGVLARRLAVLGAHVTAVDFSPELIKRAQERGQQTGYPIQYQVVDATDESALLALGESHYDALVCTMAIMDIPTVVPLYRAARRLLRAAGRMVIATAHPAFNSVNPVFFAELVDESGTLVTHKGLKLEAYLDVQPQKGTGTPGEPAPHYYFHRPLHQLLGEAFRAGLVLDALEEPAVPAADGDSGKLLSWYQLPQFPPVLALRLRSLNYS